MELANRFDLERQLAAKLAVLSASHRRDILSAIGDYDVTSLPQEFWETLEQEVREELAAQGTIIYLLMLGQWWDEWQPLAGGIPSYVGREAGDWSREWSGRTARQWTETTQERLAARPLAGLPQADRRAALINTIGPARISTLAVTSVTEAASAGSLGARDVFVERRLGGDRTYAANILTAVWQTERDEKVCRICAPLHMTREQAWVARFPSGPPAHPNCRCHLDFAANIPFEPSAN